MDDDNGFIILHRKILNWEWFDEPITFRLFIVFLLLANHKDTKWHGIEVKRGQLITGQFKMCKLLRISPQSYRTSLTRLKSTNEITIKTTNKYSVITIVKYDDYQNNKKNITNKITNKITNEQQTNNKQTTTDNNDNNDNNIISKDIIGTNVPVLKEFGNPLINNFHLLLKEFNHSSDLDGTIKENRQFCMHLINRIKKEFKERSNKEPSDNELIASFKKILTISDGWHADKMTNFKYIYKNFYQIIKTSQNNNVLTIK